MRIGELNIGVREMPVAESSEIVDQVAVGSEEEGHLCPNGGHIKQYPPADEGRNIQSRQVAEKVAQEFRDDYAKDPTIVSYSVHVEAIRGQGHRFGDLHPFAEPTTYRVVCYYSHHKQDEV